MEIKEAPKGHKTDRVNSAFDKIVFKPIEVVNSWKNITAVEGCYIDTNSDIIHCKIPTYCFSGSVDKNTFLNEKYAKSALALAQISQLLPYYDTQVDWKADTLKHVIRKFDGKIDITYSTHECYVLAFNTEDELERFLCHNEHLVKDYLMID